MSYESVENKSYFYITVIKCVHNTSTFEMHNNNVEVKEIDWKEYSRNVT